MEENKSTTKLDFGNIREVPTQPKTRLYFIKGLRIIGAVAGVSIFVTVLIGGIYFDNFKTAYTQGFVAKTQLENAQHLIINRGFEEGAKELDGAHDNLVIVQEALANIPLFRYFPFIGNQIRAIEKVTTAGIELSSSGSKLATLAGELVEPLQNESIAQTSISKDQKAALIEKVIASRDLLFEVKTQLDTATEAVQDIKVERLIPQLQTVIEPLQNLLPRAQLLANMSLPMVEVLPRLAGIDGQQSYLFLIQNNSELRPTGGFIGTYGVLRLQDAQIQEFKTDNIYNLDLPAAKILQEPTPWQLEKYLEQKDWGLRDFNWDPDFPTTAKTVVEHYHKLEKIQHDLSQEDLPEDERTKYMAEDFDGVIAITPEPIQRLLSITGPVTVEGILFTEDNFKDELEFRVGKEFKEFGIDESDRKEIIRKLADQIKIRLLSLPYHQLLGVLEIGVDALAEKQVQMYSFDPAIQELIIEHGWGGEIQETDSDYLFVVDSNFASLKTDPFVKRTIAYSFERKGDEVIATLKITYNNTANFTWKTTRLRTYTRVYVPQGSELLSFEGLMDNDKTKGGKYLEGDVEVTQEHGKTVFGGFISTEPGETNSFTYTYRLPRRIANQIKEGSYNLLVQKQAGVIPQLTLDLNYGKKIRSASPAEVEKEFFNTNYTFETELNRDSRFIVKLK